MKIIASNFVEELRCVRCVCFLTSCPVFTKTVHQKQYLLDRKF